MSKSTRPLETAARTPLLLLVRMAARSARGSRARLVLFVLALALGVGAVVAVAALADAVRDSLEENSRELLGGDLAVESRRPLPALDPLLPAHLRDTPRVSMIIATTMVRSADGTSALVELKAIDETHGRYPLYGALELAPAGPFAESVDDRSVLVAESVLSSLKVKVGDRLFVGESPLRVAGVVRREPDPLAFTLSFGPRVLLTRRALESAGLLAFGHRTRHRTVLRFQPPLAPAELARVKRELEARIPGGGTYVSVEDEREAQPALRRTLDRVQSYLGLVALLSLLVASAGIAQLVSAWIAEGQRELAVLRCLGLTPRELAFIYLGQLVVLALLGSVLGCALGALAPRLVHQLAAGDTPLCLALVPRAATLASGVATGVGMALLVSLPALTAIWTVSPLRALRSDAAPLVAPRAMRLAAGALAALACLLAAALQTRDLELALAFSAGVAASVGVLWLSARALTAGIGALPRARLPALLWHGVSALVRPTAGTRGSILALGTGTLVVVATLLLERVLHAELADALPPDAPHAYLLDVQPDQWPALRARALAEGAHDLEAAPVVVARLSSLDGKPVAELVRQRARTEAGGPNQRDRRQWVLTREQRITWAAQLPADNELVAGALWQHESPRELSVEREFARELGVKLGSVLVFDVQGVPLDFVVTSLRSVRWRSFAPNFLLVAEPHALEGAPHFLFVALRVAAAREQALQDALAGVAPNVTVLRVRGLIASTAALLAKVAQATRLLGGFAALSGLLILIAATASRQRQRSREAALLKALGVAPLRVLALFGLEFALSGAVAGLVGALAAHGLVHQAAQRLLELRSTPSWFVTGMVALATIVSCTVSGLLVSARVLATPPSSVLRGRSGG